jgi:hypothetical protein
MLNCAKIALERAGGCLVNLARSARQEEILMAEMNQAEPAANRAPALRTGRWLEWDAQAMQVTNDEEANRLVAPPCRTGWAFGQT